MNKTETTSEGATAASINPSGLSLGALTALVVGSMIGGGIFNLPRQMAAVAAPGPLLIGWLITGIGMLTLAFIYQTLATRKPDIDGGVFGYARAGFGPFVGFSSAWGYWISAWIGNVGYLVLLVTGLGYFFPGVFTNGNQLTVVGLVFASVVLWATLWLCLAGVREAAVVNTIVTIAKVVPILIFVAMAIVSFKAGIFSADFWGGSTSVPDSTGATAPLGGTLDQVKGMMLVTVWVFIGIEGASVFSERARTRADVGKATVMGFVGVLLLLVAVNLLSYGLLRQAKLAGVADPALGSILKEIVGPWGAALIAVGLVVSVLGAFLSWTLLCAEILRLPAKVHVMPALLGKDNAKGSPTWALLLTAVCIQGMLVWAKSQPSAYDFLIALASSLILLPYLFSAMYQLKLALTGESYERDRSGRTKDLVIGIVGTIYAIWLVYAGGLIYLLLSAIFYAVGIVFYVWARKEARLRVAHPAELVLMAILVAGAVYGIVGLINGSIQI